MDEKLKQFNMKTNPLSSYYRQPKIYISLPSKGEFYPDGSLDVSEDGKYPVYAMTAKDELMYKTPDALLSGQSTVEVIKSCVPAILDPWKMPSLDVDACLVAIRIATYGEEMEVNANCPSCTHENEYNLSLVNYLDTISNINYDPIIKVGDLTIFIRPYSYRELTKTAIRTIEQERIFNIINDENMSDEEKIERFGTSFVKLTELTVDIITGCITRIDTPEASVVEQDFINDFVENAPKEVFDAIAERVQELKSSFDFNSQEVECAECHHKYNIKVTMDQANFFAVRS